MTHQGPFGPGTLLRRSVRFISPSFTNLTRVCSFAARAKSVDGWFSSVFWQITADYACVNNKQINQYYSLNLIWILVFMSCLWKYSKLDATMCEETGRVSLSYLFEVGDISSCHVGLLPGWKWRITPSAPLCLGFRCCGSGRQSRWRDAVMPVVVSISRRVDQHAALWCDSTSPLLGETFLLSDTQNIVVM